jgi:hypothetical protein
VDFLLSAPLAHLHAKNPDQWACFRNLQGINIHVYEYLYHFMREAQQTPSSRGLFVSDGTLVNFCMFMQKFRLTGLREPRTANLWFDGSMVGWFEGSLQGQSPYSPYPG